MSQHCKIYLDNKENICLQGGIDFTNVVSVRDTGLELMNAVSAVRIDLAKLAQVDSSSLALLVALVRRAKQQHKKIKLFNIPTALASLIRVSGLDAILSI